MVDCAVANNTSNGLNDYGGGIYNKGTLVLSNCSVSNNVSDSPSAHGGGISSQRSLTLTDSTISGNTAVTGGGIYKKSALLGINSTISGNFSTGDGGGFYANSGSTELFNVTIARNRANSDNVGTASGGGVYNEPGWTLNFMNSIIALNELVVVTGGGNILNSDDCAGAITELGNDIVYWVDASHCTVSGSPIIADPNLGELQFNGGPTQTHALLSGSVAIDGGNAGGCTDNLGAILDIDQRGIHRPGGPRCDIGAFEVQPDLIFSNGFEP